MKRIEWNKEKDQLLIKTRSVSFGTVADLILAGKIISIHNNPSRKNQRIYIVLINNYIYCVPFVEDETKIFLKTIYANRKLNKKYNKKI